MRFVALALLLLGWGCQEGPERPDGDQAAMEVGLDSQWPVSEGLDEGDAEGEGGETREGDPPEAPPPPPDGGTEQLQETLPCPSGGSVRVTMRREFRDEPFRRYGSVRWEYDECGTWEFGEISGTASYSTKLEYEELWERELRYFADLTYAGGSDGECDAYVTLNQKWHSAEHPLDLPSTCPHPVRDWWSRLGI